MLFCGKDWNNNIYYAYSPLSEAIEFGNTPPYVQVYGKYLGVYQAYDIAYYIDEAGNLSVTEPEGGYIHYDYVFENLANGTYNFVIEKGEKTKTVLVTIENKDTDLGLVYLPLMEINSQVDVSVEVEGDTPSQAVKAIWEDIPVVEYTVNFDANGGSGAMSEVTVGRTPSTPCPSVASRPCG